MARPNRHPNAAKPWEPEDIETLRTLANAGTPLREVAAQLGRSQEAIRGRAARLGIALGKNQAALKVEQEEARRHGTSSDAKEPSPC
jgi:hypothetical protein